MDYRYGFLGIAAGVVSAAFAVSKIAAFSLWEKDDFEHNCRDAFLVVSLFFSMAGPAMCVPVACTSLLDHHDRLCEIAIAKDDNIEKPKQRLAIQNLVKVLKPYFW